MTDLFVPENPPLLESKDGQILAEYLYRQILNIRDEFDYPKVGRGGLTLNTPAASTLLLTQTPIKITAFDAQILPELYVESNLTNSTIKVLKSGLWFLSIKGIARVASSSANVSRGFVVELYNETTAQTYKVIDYSGVARFADIADYTISTMLYIPVSVLGDDFAIYVYTVNVNTIQFTSVEILDFAFVMIDDLLVPG